MYYDRDDGERKTVSYSCRHEGATDHEKRLSVKQLRLKSKPERGPHNLCWGTKPGALSERAASAPRHIYIYIENHIGDGPSAQLLATGIRISISPWGSPYHLSMEQHIHNMESMISPTASTCVLHIKSI